MVREPMALVKHHAQLVVIFLAIIVFVPAIATAQDEVVYYHTDAIGSVRMVTDATGAVVARYDYAPFGTTVPTNPPNANPDRRQFAGKERDNETSLDYFGARYLRGESGRFITTDPVLHIEAALSDPQRWNRYAYALNNPLRNVDPDGRDSLPTAWNMGRGADGLMRVLPAIAKELWNVVVSLNSPGHPSGAEAAARRQAQFMQPANTEEAVIMGLTDVAMLAAPLARGPGALRTVGAIDDVIATPSVLRGGVTPEQLMNRLGSLPETWRVEGLGKGGARGEGFLLREYKLGPKRAEPTGRMIRWHPGGGHHGDGPYWKVVDYNGPGGEIR